MKRYFYIITAFLCVNAFGQVTTIVPEINGSGGLSMDSAGNLYIADFGDLLAAGDGHLNNVWKLSRDGELTVYAEGFLSASGNALNSEGILYQSDIGGDKVYRIIDGIPVLFAETNISNPVGLVFDAEDNLYVCNCGSNDIAKVTPEGVSTIFSTGPLFFCPNGITIDHEGTLYVSNFSNGNVIKIDELGNASLHATIPGANNGHLRYCEEDTNVYVCSHGSSSIYKVNPEGEVELFAGTGERGNDDGVSTDATFSRPNGIVFSPHGDTLYVNSTIPEEDSPGIPLNPSVIRRITGVKTGVVSIEPFSKTEIEIFPNPTMDGVITITGENINCIEVLDVTGRVLLTRELMNNPAKFQLTGETGVYYVNLHTADGQILKKSVLKLN